MSETISKTCEGHPCGDPIFKRAVLRTLVSRQASLIPRPSNPALSYERISQLLGADEAFGRLVNECANGIQAHRCSQYLLVREGVNVELSRFKGVTS